jgi:hypothetical protein
MPVSKKVIGGPESHVAIMTIHTVVGLRTNNRSPAKAIEPALRNVTTAQK